MNRELMCLSTHTPMDIYVYIYVRGTFWVHFTYITCMRNLIYLPINFFNFFNFWGSLREINEIKEIN